MGNVNEACSTTKEAGDCTKERRDLMPWARSDWQGDQPAGQLPIDSASSNRYLTAQGEDVAGGRAGNRGVPPLSTSSGALPMPPGSSDYSGRPGSAARTQLGSSSASSSSNAPRGSKEPEVRHDDWEAIHHSSGASGRPQKLGTAEREHIDRHIGRDEELENRAALEEAKQCYFDLELGEAGPASTGGDHSLGRERKWHRFRSGATYDGEWLGGVRDGVGKQCWPDGTVYVGEWRRGRAGGRGEIRHYDGDVYTGEWINGRSHGSGVYRHQGSHAIYEGEFRCDMREGMGVELWVDGSWYAGEFRKGAKHGFGEHRWPMPSGTYYVGSWRANELAGAGRYFVKDGPSYQGEWMNSVIDGAGVYTWVDGQQYEGQYQLDRKHGFGILTTPDGESKEGFWNMGHVTDQDPTVKGS